MHDRSKVLAIFREYPHLGQYFKPDRIHEVYVRRWDDEMLNYPSVGYSDTLVSVRNIFYLFDANFALVGVVGEDPRILWWDPRTWYVYPEIVQTLDALIKRSATELERVSSIVGIHLAPDGYGHKDWKLVVWKAPNSYKNLREWLEATIEGHRKKELFLVK